MDVVSVNDPSSPKLVGSISFPYNPKSMVVSGNFAYYIFADEVYIIDFSDPASPSEARKAYTANGASFTRYGAYELAISGKYLYAVDYKSGLHVLDISTPVSPINVNSPESTSIEYKPLSKPKSLKLLIMK